MLRGLRVRLRGLFGRDSWDAELDEEMRYHVERDVARRVASGASLADAGAEARRAFGNTTYLAEEARAASRIAWVEELIQDARYAMRAFARTPRFALTVALTIGVGIGLVSAAFTVFNAYVLRPLEVRDPGSLFELTFRDSRGATRYTTWREYETLAQGNPAFSETFAYRGVVTWRGGEPMMLQLVTGNYFRMVGVGAALGRTLEPAEARPGVAAAVLVLSHQTWRTKFGSDPGVVGRRLVIRDRSFEIIGVAREGFNGLTDTPPDFWAPLPMLAVLEDGHDFSATAGGPLVKVIGRLVPGPTRAGAERALGAWVARVTADRAPSDRAAAAVLESRATAAYMPPSVMAELSPVFLAFTFVLLIACANVSNMLLARGMARQREIGTRLALGASRGRIVRQLLTESFLLASVAAVIGFAFSRAAIALGTGILMATVPPVVLPYVRPISLAADVRLLVFLVAAAIVSAVAFGMAPALQTTRADLVGATRGELIPGIRPARLRNLLVVGQVTLCALLLVCAGIFIRAATRVERADVGFSAAGMVQVRPPAAVRARVIERLRSEPAITGLASASQAPLDGGFQKIVLGAPSVAATVAANRNRVSPDYFVALSIPMVRGRTFTSDETRAGEPVAIVSEATAARLWPRREAIGASIRIGSATDPDAPPRVARVVGVVGDVAAGIVAVRRDQPIVYEPLALDATDATLLVSTRLAADVAKQRIVRTLSEIDPGGATEMHTIDESMSLQVYPFRVAHWIASGLGVLALVLTVTGLYGVLSFTLALRTKEIGIRVALGASRSAITRLVVGQGLRLTVIGIVAGSLLALGASRFIASRLWMIPAFDGMALAIGATVVLLAAVAAAFEPSRLASRVDPVIAMKE